jgi:hypothetical protein
MSSPILLGTTQMAEHGLAAPGVSNTWSGWAGTFGVGAVSLFLHSFTIKNPNGAAVYGYTCMTSYTTIAFSSALGAVWIDGTYTSSWGLHFWPRTGYHTPQSFAWWTGILSPGAHTINTGLYVNGGNGVFDSSDGGTSMMWEHP